LCLVIPIQILSINQIMEYMARMEIITHARELDKEKQGFTSSDMAKVTGLSQCHRQKN